MSALIPTYARADLSFVKGEGVFLETADGEKYLDFGAGVAVASLGHAHPALVSALTEQAQTLWHTSLHDPRAGAAGETAQRSDICRSGVLYQLRR